MDYPSLLIYPAWDDWNNNSTTDPQGFPLIGNPAHLSFARHNLMANVCFCDGSVQLLPISGSQLNPMYNVPVNQLQYWDTVVPLQ
jgi:prepilin-type processing-associated H-X9-DG protein